MSVTPDFIGQVYKDTLTGNIWRANSLTPGDWTLEVQNMQTKWEPRTLKFSDKIGFFTFADLPGVTKIVFEQATTMAGIDLEYMADLVEVNFPNLVSIDPTNSQGGYLNIQDCTSLTALNLSVLETAINYVQITGCSALNTLDISSLISTGQDLAITDTVLTAIDLSSLTGIGRDLNLSNHTEVVSIDCSSLLTVPRNVSCFGNTSCTTVNFAVFLPTNGKNVDFSNCALSQASVDHVLARCVANVAYVSGSVNLSGGTNSAPTSVGVGSDYETLTLRGVTVSVN